ncbi:MAG: hypothetical protein GY730_04915 [bacterium]|nr:hypothetical protein [bacterium]
MNTLISYLYRDADNYKVHRDEVLQGILSPEQKQAMFSKCDGDNEFVPEDVGLNALQEELQAYDSQDWDSDHPIHELQKIENTKQEPTITMTAQEIYSKFIGIEAWDSEKAVQHILNK